MLFMSESFSETSCGLTHAEPSLTSTDSLIPQPKPRTAKIPDMPLDFSKTPPKPDKIISPVRDDLLDDDEDEFGTYSDKKKFWENVTKETAHKRMSLHEVSATTDKDIADKTTKKRVSVHEIGQVPIPKPRSTLQSSKSLIESGGIEEKPRVQTYQSLVESEPLEKDIKKDETVVEKDKSAVEMKIAKAIEAENIHAQEELTSIIEDIESTGKQTKFVSEYQAAYTLPSDRKDKAAISDKASSESHGDKDDSLDSDKAQKGSSQLFETTGYISDSEDVENVISDSEIEDRVPQIRERQMSVFAAPVTQRKTIYERSASLPTEDLYEVSRNLKHLKEKYEEQIKQGMIEEHISTENEEDTSPERKTLGTLQEETIAKLKAEDGMSRITEEASDESSDEKPSEDHDDKSVEEQDEKPFSVKELRKSFEQKTHMYDQFSVKTEEKIFKIVPKETTKIVTKLEPIEQITEQFIGHEVVQEKSEAPEKVSVKDLAKTYEKQVSLETTKTQKEEDVQDIHDEKPETLSKEPSPQPKGLDQEELHTHKVEDDLTVSTTQYQTHKETERDVQRNIFESQPSQSSEKSGDVFDDPNYKDESYISKDSMEVHVDKSEIEDSEKLGEFEQETDYESKSFDSLNAEQSPKMMSEEIPEITVTLSGKQRRISEESDETSEKVDTTVHVSPIEEVAEKSPIKQPEEYVPEIIWETAVETQVEPRFEEKVDEMFDIKAQMKLTEEFIATEKVLGQKELSSEVSDKEIQSVASETKTDTSDTDRIPSEEEDEFSQVEHIVKKQSYGDHDILEQHYKLQGFGYYPSEEYQQDSANEFTSELLDRDVEEKTDFEDFPSEKLISEAAASEIKKQITDEAVEELQQDLSESLLEEEIPEDVSFKEHMPTKLEKEDKEKAETVIKHVDHVDEMTTDEVATHVTEKIVQEKVRDISESLSEEHVKICDTSEEVTPSLKEIKEKSDTEKTEKQLGYKMKVEEVIKHVSEEVVEKIDQPFHEEYQKASDLPDIKSKLIPDLQQVQIEKIHTEKVDEEKIVHGVKPDLDEKSVVKLIDKELQQDVKVDKYISEMFINEERTHIERVHSDQLATDRTIDDHSTVPTREGIVPSAELIAGDKIIKESEFAMKPHDTLTEKVVTVHEEVHTVNVDDDVTRFDETKEHRTEESVKDPTVITQTPITDKYIKDMKPDYFGTPKTIISDSGYQKTEEHTSETIVKDFKQISDFDTVLPEKVITKETTIIKTHDITTYTTPDFKDSSPLKTHVEKSSETFVEEFKEKPDLAQHTPERVVAEKSHEILQKMSPVEDVEEVKEIMMSDDIKPDKIKLEEVHSKPVEKVDDIQEDISVSSIDEPKPTTAELPDKEDYVEKHIITDEDISEHPQIKEDVSGKHLKETKEEIFKDEVVEKTLKDKYLSETKSEEKDDLSSGLREESDLGSELQMDHSDSATSDRLKSESHSEIEKIILDTFHHMKVDPEEAKRIASQLIEDIENEIQNRSELTASDSTQDSVVFNSDVSNYIKQLAETNGLDEREVELVESVLARRQRELSKLARGDTQASSMEITDEDLRHSGGEFTDYTHILQQQIGQLEAERKHDIEMEYDTLDREKYFEEKSETFDRVDEKHKTEEHHSEDTESYDSFKAKKSKKDVTLSISDSLKAEKIYSEERNVILEEDETISESSVKEQGKVDAHIESVVSEAVEVESEDSILKELKTGAVDWDDSRTFYAEIDHIQTTSDKLDETIKTEHLEDQDISKVEGHFIADRTVTEITGDLLKEIKETSEKDYTESVQKTEEDHRKEISKTEKISDDVEISTSIAVDRKILVTSSEIVTKEKTKEETLMTSTKSIEEDEFTKLLDDISKAGVDAVITKTQTIHRTSSSDSKSSFDSAKSPDRKYETSTREHVVLRKAKSEVDSSSTSSNLKPDRISGIEFEAYSSSGESHYQSFEMDSARSRPCSSDVEGIIAAASSEYETALTSTQEFSAKSHVTSTDYHTAISSISSKESMKSLDSESSGNLASIEVSEHSETLVPSTSDIDGDMLDSIDQQFLEDAEPSSGWTGHGRRGRQISDFTDSEMIGDSVDISEDDINDIDSKLGDVPSKMKRSAEMTFQPEPKVLTTTESPQGEHLEAEEKYAHSLDEGSILSISMSSTSSTGAQRTVIELLDKHEGTSEHHSLDETEITMRGSQESLPLTPTLQKSYDIATSTPHTQTDVFIDNVTMTTTSVKEDGIHSASTQITSETKDISSVAAHPSKFPLEEPKRKGHRRTESTMIGISLSTLAPEYKDTVTTEKKEKEMYESEKDIDEKEQKGEKDVLDDVFDNEDVISTSRPLSGISRSDSEKERPVSIASEFELADLAKSTDLTDITDPIERPSKPEPQEMFKDDSVEFSLEQEFSSKTKEVAMELQRKRSTSSVSDASKEILEKRDSHGKSSTTSSEKSSFEEAEADAVFNMVAHISPAHKVKQIIPILEDEDAEKHELEMREKAKKELEERRAQMKDISPGFIPDITVTEHMTPELELDSDKEDKQQHISDESPLAESVERAEEVMVTSSESEHDQKQDERDIADEIMTTSMMKSSLIDSITTESEAITIIDAAKAERDVDSQSSDSFEMLEKPDIIDDFVVIEEVAKEAKEFDSEGKSVYIEKPARKVKKHDEELEQYLVRSAPTPLTGIKYYPDGSSSDELGFEFEDSPPKPDEGKQGVASTRDYGYEYDRELEANKRWIEQQFQGNQAAMMAAGYGYEMEFERGPLEDIKEEDINDFAASSYGSQKESAGSLGSAKDSYSSTPDYDVLAGRKYFTRSGEPDDISMSSLQEFENLEQAMSLEMRRFHQGQGSDSSSSGSYKIKFHHSKNNTGDDISVSSLKEFEGLEKACIQAHKIEVKAKEEEAMLAQIEEGQESIASESESCETAGTERKITDTEEDEDYEKRMFEIDEIIKQAQTNVERFVDLREIEKTESLGRGDSVEEVSKVPDLELDSPIIRSTIKVQWKESEDVMITSTDSLDFKEEQEEEDRRDSADSLDAQVTVGDIMTASTDSIEFQAQKAKDTIMTDSIEFRDEKSYMVSSDSLELGPGTSSGFNIIQSDSIEEDVSKVGLGDHSISSTGKDFSSSTREELLEHDTDLGKDDKEELATSIASVDPTSSTATHATMHCETDSVFSGSFTSGGSNTMVSSTDTIDSTYARETVDVSAAVRKVWFDEDLTGRRVTEYVEESSRPYVSEVIEPLEEEHFSHTIHRKVELRPEVRKVTFTGPDAEEQLRKFMEEFNEGEDVQETQSVDEHGNIHTKRVVQKRFIIKGDTEHPMTTDHIEEYFKELNQPEVVQDRGVITRSTKEAVITKTITDDQGTTQTIIVKKFDLPQSLTGEEHSQPSSSQKDTSKPQAEPDSIPELPDKDKSRKIADQHQLSDEMKELLQEMEKESKE